MAFGIMIYHYLSWSMGKFPVDSFIARIGIYGVSIFYILSGITLYYVYFDDMIISKEDVIYFFKKRVLRIFPLLWLVTISSILLSNQAPDLYSLFLNLSGLFGFIQWDIYFSEGIWSIGNELFFYALFPFLILFTKKMKPLMALLTVFLFGTYLYFAFSKLNPDLSLGKQWKNYVNPLNQAFLFLGGFLMGHLFEKKKINDSIITYSAILSASVFVLYPVSGDTINLVTGYNRIVFTFCCFMICLFFYKAKFKLTELIHKPLSILGESSYSIYLLHPIIFKLMRTGFSIFEKHFIQFPQWIRILSPLIITLFVSYYVYQYFEKYFMKFGRRHAPAAV